jgi:hypothetical protein
MKRPKGDVFCGLFEVGVTAVAGLGEVEDRVQFLGKAKCGVHDEGGAKSRVTIE